MKSIAFLRKAWRKWTTHHRDEQTNGRWCEPRESASPLTSIPVKASSSKRHYSLNWPYCSRSRPAHHPKVITTDLFCAETPYDLPGTLLVALKARQHPVNLQSMTATSCLDCPHSYHLLRPTIYKVYPVLCSRKTSKIPCHIKKNYKCHNR